MNGNGLPFTSKDSDGEEFDINGEIVLLRTYLEDVTDYSTTIADSLFEEAMQKVCLQLVSTDKINQEMGEGKRGQEISISLDDPKDEYMRYNITFKWNVELGEPGALLVKNAYAREFFFKSLTLFAVPGKLPALCFFCNSWIFPFYLFGKGPRVFFSTKSHLPDETPAGLITLRERELSTLRGSGSGERKFWERVYDYDVYNDLGNPDESPNLHRPVLGRSHEFPYPRRCRTGRPPTETDSNSESLTETPFFIPPDEKPPHINVSDYRADSVRAFAQKALPAQKSDLLYFSSLEEVKAVYSNYGFPIPQVLKANEFAWMKDEEFARQALSGLNPMAIQCLQSFPPSSSMDAELHGPQQSFISAHHIQKNLDGLSVEQKGSSEYDEMVKDPETYMLKSVSNKWQTIQVMGILLLLSQHSTDEVYLGQLKGSTPEWTDDEGIPNVFAHFTSALENLEKNITERNKNPQLKNRYGPGQVPYTLLYPSTSDHSNEGGLTGMGVPNSVSI